MFVCEFVCDGNEDKMTMMITITMMIISSGCLTCSDRQQAVEGSKPDRLKSVFINFRGISEEDKKMDFTLTL